MKFRVTIVIDTTPDDPGNVLPEDVHKDQIKNSIMEGLDLWAFKPESIDVERLP